MRDIEIAKIIHQQLGGGRFIVMTGAKNFYAIENGLQFDLPKNGSKANRVRIILDWDDTYTMQFLKKETNFNPYTIIAQCIEKGMTEEQCREKIKSREKASEARLLKSYSGVYCDQLQELFTEYTKMYTRL